MNLPSHTVDAVISFVGSDEALQALRQTCKRLRDSIVVHPRMQNLKCDHCGSRRWTVTSRRRECIVRGCMAAGIHVRRTYISVEDKPLCSYGCLLGHAQRSDRLRSRPADAISDAS